MFMKKSQEKIHHQNGLLDCNIDFDELTWEINQETFKLNSWEEFDKWVDIQEKNK